MQFLHPSLLLYGFASLGFLLIIFATLEWFRARRACSVFSRSMISIARTLAFKYFLLLIIGGLIIGALAQPFMLRPRLVASGEDAYLMILFDLSWSMDARRVEGSLSRIERGKETALYLLPLFQGGDVSVYGYTDRFGSFADFTTDHSFIRSTIKNVIYVESVMGSGSDITGALRRAAQQFPEKTEKKKFILLLSDGGDVISSEDSLGELSKIAAFLKREEIKVISIGIGELEGVVLGEQDGKPIISALNEETLKRVAEATDGVYIRESGNEEILKSSRLFLSQVLGKDVLTRQDTTDISGWFAAAAIFFLWFLWFFFGHRAKLDENQAQLGHRRE